MRNLSWISGAVVLLCTGIAGVSSAAPVSPVFLQIDVDGVMAGTYDHTQIGCTDGSAESQTFHCGGGGQYGGQYGMNITWDMTFDADPVISGNVAVTNLSATDQQFTLIFTLPTTVSPSSVMGGGLQGGVTDLDGDGATISAPVGSAIYKAFIDNTLLQQSIYSAPFSYTEPNANQSSSFASVNWGTPIPSAPGPAVNTNIRIQLDFMLSGSDSASITSNFVVVVPEPSTALLLAFGVGALALYRRRSH